MTYKIVFLFLISGFTFSTLAEELLVEVTDNDQYISSKNGSRDLLTGCRGYVVEVGARKAVRYYNSFTTVEYVNERIPLSGFAVALDPNGKLHMGVPNEVEHLNFLSLSNYYSDTPFLKLKKITLDIKNGDIKASFYQGGIGSFEYTLNQHTLSVDQTKYKGRWDYKNNKVVYDKKKVATSLIDRISISCNR